MFNIKPNKLHSVIFIALAILCIQSSYSQSTDEEKDSNIDFNVYGIFRAHLAMFDGNAEIQDASPRVGFHFDYHFGDDNNYKIYFGGEFAVNLIDNVFNFEADPNSSQSGYDLLQFNDNVSTFSTRLGFIGVSFDQYGSIELGKLNSVYKDVAGRTDIFNVMSGQASYVYSPTGADGGETGTGRAEGALIYRNKFKKLDVGLQTTMKANDSKFFDSYAVSLRYELIKGLSLGTAYNRAFLGPRFLELESLEGLEGDPEYFTAGITYNRGPLFLSGMYASQKNGDFVNVISLADDVFASVIYPGKGFELVGTYRFMDNKLKLLAGFNYKKPDSESELVHDDFGKKLYLLGLQYQFIKYASIYSEYKYEDSYDVYGVKSPSVFLVGLRLDFNRTWSKFINL